MHDLVIFLCLPTDGSGDSRGPARDLRPELGEERIDEIDTSFASTREGGRRSRSGTTTSLVKMWSSP